ncbi:hypothetical protein A3K73_02405 [Candidatus Pacearchaeota archaeon RBG_13_36_9]|nr:MAG: hypothetical protein A3K73_02405 [Candidatus Pacearchaeota archaeon RBG_13_36_9]
MRIIGFNFKKISAERKSDLKGKLQIKTHMDLEKIEKEELDIAGEILRFSFVYAVNYEPDHAVISFEGSVLIKPDKGYDTKQLLRDWKKKKLPEEVRLLVFNFVMTKCNLRALQLEEEFSLPPHIPLPRISKEQEGKANYTG